MLFNTILTVIYLVCNVTVTLGPAFAPVRCTQLTHTLLGCVRETTPSYGLTHGPKVYAHQLSISKQPRHMRRRGASPHCPLLDVPAYRPRNPMLPLALYQFTDLRTDQRTDAYMDGTLGEGSSF
jgi:hypothetical protein